jgi:hypothetical protein
VQPPQAELLQRAVGEGAFGNVAFVGARLRIVMDNRPQALPLCI